MNQQLRIYVAYAIAAMSSHQEGEALVAFLRSRGFRNVFDPKEHPIDHARDWRDAEGAEILRFYHRLESFICHDVDVIVADLDGASDGRMLEMVLAGRYGKPVIGFAQEPINSPWRFVYVTRLARTHEELIAALQDPGAQNPIFYG